MAYRTTSWKNTDSGQIPSDWDSDRIENLFDLGNGYTPSKENSKFWNNGTIPWFRLDDIRTNGHILYDSLKHVTKFGIKGNLFPANSIIISTTATVGEHALIRVASLANQQFTCLNIKQNRNEMVDMNYFYHYCFIFDNWCKDHINFGGLTAVDKVGFRQYEVPLPSILEQQKIATVLTDLDDLIAELENVRNKKQAIKFGAMQELLTGKRRLPGFNKPWKEVELGSVCTIETGKKDVNEGNPSGKYYFFTCAKEHTFADSFSYDTEAILIAGNGEVGHCQYYNGKFEVYQRTYVLYNCITNIKLLFQYMMYFFQKYIQDEIQQGAMPYIKRGTLRNFNVLFPVDETEQEKLEQILSDMDDEISAINDKINKYKQIKAGVADELLSGRIRLIKPQE